MLLLRALNELDILSEPEKNGIASKKLIKELTKSHYETKKEYQVL